MGEIRVGTAGWHEKKTGDSRWGACGQVWAGSRAALERLRSGGKLGAVLRQFPPWFPISRANKEYIVACAERVAPDRVCVEFRNHTWMTEGNQKETLEFLSGHDL